MTVDDHHIIQTSELTTRTTPDVNVVDNLILPMANDVDRVTADTAYDTNGTYDSLHKKFNKVDVVIPPKKGSTYNKNNARQRNRNVEEIKCYGRGAWQRLRDYGKRNQSECAIGRYKRILGNKLHAREFSRQKQEALIGCSILY